MIRDIAFWIALIGWAITIIAYYNSICKLRKLRKSILKLSKLQGQYFSKVKVVNEYLVYYNGLIDKFYKFIDAYNSRHSDKIVYRDGDFALVNDSDVEPVNINEL